MTFPTISDLYSISDPVVLLTGLGVFFARIVDVSVGTVRTIVTVQGKTVIAFVLAVFEVTIWISVVSTVIHQVEVMPILVIFYSLGYATGNVVGILVERRLALGMIILRIFSQQKGQELANTFRTLGQPVTIFHGEGMKGPVLELFIASRRRHMKWMLPKINEIDPDAFFVVEQARDVRKVLKPVATPLGGWRQRHNRK